MKKNTLLLAFIYYSFICFSQKMDWTITKEWCLYDIHNSNAFYFSLDTLKTFRSILLNDSVMSEMLGGSIEWPDNRAPVWMGLYVTTTRLLDGSIRKLDVSVYGGFFYDELNKAYYSVSPEKKAKWLGYLHDSMAKLSSESSIKQHK